MTSNKVFLTKALYLPEKRQIVLEFSSTEKKFSKRYSFFPFFYIPNSPRIVSAVKKFDSKKLKVDILNQGTARIIGATFNDLKKASELIKNFFNKEVLLIPAQKQFLIEKNWSYFDSFKLENEELVKKEAIAPPNVFLEVLCTSTQKVFCDLKTSDEKDANVFLEKICLSNILKTSILDLPFTTSSLAGLHLENIFFKHKFPVLTGVKTKESASGINLNENLNGFVKINFLSVLKSLSAFPFYNLGFDSINCECCKKNGTGKKVSPSSLVKTEFLVDGVYFESSLKSWVQNFHAVHGCKQQRIAFQKEWCLPSIPAGPFFSGKKVVVPLADYKFLVQKNLVKKSFCFVKKVWFCEKKESFLSAELKGFERTAKTIKKSALKVHCAKISATGILFSQALSNDFSYSYFKAFLEQSNKISSAVFLMLLNPSNRFFDENLSDSIECIQGAVMRNFRDFAQENGSHSTKLKHFNAFIKSKNPFFLAKQFSTAFNLPFPEITI